MKRLMERLRELLAPLFAQTAQLRARLQTTRDRGLDVWNRLSARDQQLVTWFGSAVGTLMLVVFVYFASAHLGTLRRAIDSRSRQLVQVREMRTQYSEEKLRLDQINSRLKASSGPPRTFLEEKARETHVDGSLDGMRDLAAPPNDLFKTQVIEVKLKKVSVANVTRYLHKIETTGVGVSVRSLRLEPNFQDVKYLNATIEVLSLRPKEE